MGIALALEGHAHLAVASCQPRLLDAGDPAGAGHLCAHHAPLVGCATQDLPGRGRIGICVGEGDVAVGEQTSFKRRGMVGCGCHAESGLPVIIEHESALPTVGGLVDKRLRGADLI